mgnify:CR=1 FL=1
MDNYTIKIAKGLANNADARLIRQQVFVEEQGFVNEFDDIDHEAYHAVIYTGGYPIATGRLFDEKGEAHIGRICVRKAYRGRDLGRMIVEALEKQAEKVGYKEVGLSAQTRVQQFYEKLGYRAYGDVYKGVEMKIPAAGKTELVYTNEAGEETRELIHNFETPGIIQGMHNIDKSISSFARSCFNYALDQKLDVWFATKDTISKIYDHRFKDIFSEIFKNEYKEKFENAGITYFYTLIDDAVARVMKSEGGFIWACKNYDGDVMSDMVSTAYGSLAMMTSVLVSPTGIYEYEAAHGTVQRHYYKYLKGEETSTNSVATIFAWTGALRKRGELDNLPELMQFADKLEAATIQTIEDGVMTGDLYLISKLENKKKVNSKEFLEAIRERLDAAMQ